jgi:hypothetical protein
MQLLTRPLRRAVRDRGATLPEYAIGIGVIALAIIGGVEFATDRGEARLQASDTRIGTPTDQGAYSVGTTTTFVPGATTTTLPGGVGLVVAQITAAPAPSQGSPNNKWIANVTIRVTDSAGTPISGVQVDGDWSVQGGGANDGNCTTGTTGTCTVQRPDISDSEKIVSFTIATMAKVGYAYTAPTPPHSGSVDCTSVAGIC